MAVSFSTHLLQLGFEHVLPFHRAWSHIRMSWLTAGTYLPAAALTPDKPERLVAFGQTVGPKLSSGRCSHARVIASIRFMVPPPCESNNGIHDAKMGRLSPLPKWCVRRARSTHAVRAVRSGRCSGCAASPPRERVHDFQQLDKASSAVAATIIQRLCSRHCV